MYSQFMMHDQKNIKLAVRVVETAIIGKIHVPDRREARKFPIDSHIGLRLHWSTHKMYP